MGTMLLMAEQEMGPLESSLREVGRQHEFSEMDMPLIELTLTYACEIDDGGDLQKLGPALLNALEALHLSPRARAAAMRGAKTGGTTPGTSKLDELRARRARKNGAANLDAASS